MISCKLPNYSDSKYKNLDLNLELTEDLDSLFNTILDGLEKQKSFSIHPENSMNRSEYNDSVTNLVDKIIKDIEDKKIYKGSNISELKEKLINKLTEYKYTQVDQVIMAVIPDVGLITEEEREDIKFKDLVNDIIGTSSNVVFNTIQTLFKQRMKISTIISDTSLVTNKEDMNYNIKEFLQELYLIIKHFLEQLYNGKTELTNLLGFSLYYDDDIRPTAYNTFLIMYNYINALKQKGTFESEMNNGWEDNIFNNTNGISLYQAVSAYISVVYFDDFLRSVLGQYINIDKSMDLPIEIVNNKTKYKYSFANRNSNAVKTWGVETRDSLKEMSKFSQVLIESIELYDYESKSKEYGYMEVKDFVNTMTSLFDLIPKLSSHKDLQEALIEFRESPSKSIKIIFDYIFHSKSVIDFLFDNGFDLNYLNYLYSIYKTVFNGRKSWYYIETKYKLQNNIPNVYSIIDTILSEINSNTSAKYLLTIFKQKENPETSIKTKFNIKTNKFKIIDNLNDIINNSANWRSNILKKYNLVGNNDFTLTIGDISILISPRGNNNLLIKKSKNRNFISVSINNDIPSKFIPENISNHKTRHEIFNGNRTLDQENLLEVLKFLDDILGTSFSTSEQGLLQFYLIQKINPNNFHEMLISAVKGLLITKIYDGFENAKDENGNKYRRNELVKFLSNEGYKYLNISWDTLADDYLRTIELQGPLLYVTNGIEDWLLDYSKVFAILNGDTSASTISNFEGKKFPNYTPSFLGSNLYFQLKLELELGGASSNLLFAKHPDFISDVVINLEVRTQYGNRKQVSEMNISELLYDSIVNKFIIPYYQGLIYTQASTYADKSKIITYGIKLSNLFENGILNSNFEKDIEELMIESIGLMYKVLWESVKNDYIKLIKYLRSIGNESVENIKIIETTSDWGNNTSIDKVDLNNWLKTLTEEQLINLVNDYNENNSERLTFTTELHYRNFHGHLALNELLQEYITNIYANSDNLHKVLAKKKIDFANDLLKYRVKIKYDKFTKDTTDPIYRFINEVLGTHVDEWVSGTTLAVGLVYDSKGNHKLVTHGQVKDGENFILNPVLNLYFLLDNLIGNNLRYSITGSETNHKIKELNKTNLNKEFSLWKNEINALLGWKEDRDFTFIDILNAISKMTKNSPKNEQIKSKYNSLIYSLSNLAQNALFKRNVPIPGTIKPYLLKCINGMGSKMNIAVIKDVEADVFNFNGKVDTIDAHDGSAFINPIASILENWSLQGSEVGLIKKPLHHYLDPRTGTAVLLKYAVDTITNQWMRLSEGNGDIRLREVVKKMLNNRWNGGIDLINSCQFRSESKINFSEDILSNNTLYYWNGSNHVLIVDFGIEQGVYYTIEQNVNNFGIKDSDLLKIYHYFDENGNHETYTELLTDNSKHTIDSLYELHTVLGGIFSESLIDGSLLYSEASNYAVARWCNYVALKKENTKITDPIDQDYYYLPLKDSMIHMIANQSAVKNGAANINPSERYKDNNKLSYFTVGTEYYGILLDADHDADEAVLTEFSLVIASLDVDGELHDYVTEVYQALGEVSLQLAEIELNGIELFNNDGEKTHLYEVIGKCIIENLKDDSPGLTKTILERIKKEFNLKSNHKFDRLLIPFSDPNLYSLILPTFVSIINNKSIKRKYPGSGIVIVPGYNLSMIYEINGEPYQYLDILKLAYKWAKENNFVDDNKDIYLRNKNIVNTYLQDLQSKQPSLKFGEIAPTDNIYTKYLKDDGTFKIKHISLNKIQDYYKYTDSRFNLFGIDDNLESKIEGDVLTIIDSKQKIEGLLIYNNGIYTINVSDSRLLPFLYEALPQNQKIQLTEEQRNIFGETKLEQPKAWGVTTIYKDVTRPRNLAPQKIFYDVDGERTNIYLHWKVKRLFTEKTGNIKLYQKEAQEAFLELKRDSKYTDEYGLIHDVSNVDILAAELIVSNIYKSKFGMKDSDSLADMKDSSKFILSNLRRSSTIFDLCFTGNTDTYISFTSLYGNTHCKQTRQREVLIPFNDHRGGKSKVVERIYAVTSDNVRLFEIGRVIKTEGVTYEKDNDNVYRFYEKNKDGEKVKASGTYKIGENGEVLEVVHFVTKYNIKEKSKRSIGYSINQSAIEKVMEQRTYTDEELTIPGTNNKLTQDLKYKSEINNYIAKLLGDIYKNGEHNGIQVNPTMSELSKKSLVHVWNRFANQLSYNSELYKYLQKLGDEINSGKLHPRKLVVLLNDYNKTTAKERHSSFQKSLNYIASRIPAQTLQSFMLMKCVGFTNMPGAQCFVSHWLTWLQGSKINKN